MAPDAEKPFTTMSECVEEPANELFEQRITIAQKDQPDQLYALHLASCLSDLRNSSKLTDIDVQCGAETFHLHRTVLSCGSGHFSNLFEQDNNIHSHALELSPPIEPGTFGILAKSCYTGTIVSDITEDNAIPLLLGSHQLQVDHASLQCTEYLSKQRLDLDSCLPVWLAAFFCDNAKLLTKATAFIGRHLEDISILDDFLGLSKEKVIALLSDDGLCAPTEVAVYEAALRWIRYDEEARRGEVAGVLGAVRFPFLPAKYLTNVVGREPLVLTDHDAMHIYSHALTHKLDWGVEPKVKKRHSVMHGWIREYEKVVEKNAVEQAERKQFEARTRGLEIPSPEGLKPERSIKEQIIKSIIIPVANLPRAFQRDEARSIEDDGSRSWAKCRGSFCYPEGEERAGNGNVIASTKHAFEKYIKEPIERSPCIPGKEEEDRATDDDDDLDRGEERGGNGNIIASTKHAFDKYIKEPIVRAPCIPGKGKEDGTTDDDDDELDRGVERGGSGNIIVSTKHAFDKYIKEPIVRSPCIPGKEEEDGTTDADDDLRNLRTMDVFDTEDTAETKSGVRDGDINSAEAPLSTSEKPLSSKIENGEGAFEKAQADLSAQNLGEAGVIDAEEEEFGAGEVGEDSAEAPLLQDKGMTSYMKEKSEEGVCENGTAPLPNQNLEETGETHADEVAEKFVGEEEVGKESVETQHLENQEKMELPLTVEN